MDTDQWLFPPSIAAAKEYQTILARRVIREDDEGKTIKTILGVDVSNNRFDPKQMVYASAVVLTYPELKLIETATHAQKQPFPYVTGLLGFREAPVIIEAIRKLTIRPDLIFVDGHGISHPRGLGIASHLGVLLDMPTIGVAKSILIGQPLMDLSEERGSQVPLAWKGKTVGTLLRTKRKCLPLIISTGHRISLSSAVSITMSCVSKYRLIEPIRHAHLAANTCRIREQEPVF